MEIIPFRDFGQYPPLMWVVLVAFLALFIDAAAKFNKNWSKPALAVYVTLFLWYPGNFIYVGTAFFQHRFSDEVINRACLQLLSFLAVFRLTLPMITKRLRPKVLPKGFVSPALSSQITPILLTVFGVWLVLFLIGWYNLERSDDIKAVLWPPTSPIKVGLFVHRGIGRDLDFLVAVGQYVYQLCAVFFGVAAVIATGWTRIFAWVMVALTWPYFMFARVRNVQLSLIAPAITAFLLLGKSKIWVKICTAFAVLFAVHLWFLMVIDYRTDHNLARFKEYFTSSSGKALTGFHYGLEMMEELCYMNSFIDSGKMRVTYGLDYFHESLNFVPRAIWPNKPRLGFEYLMARGMSNTQVRGQEMTINATIATGVVGQGLLNFGIYFGAPFAALLMSAWAALLAKLWDERWHLGKAFLMLMGLGLTFNLGRGLSLLVIWPFVFGVVLVWFYGMIFDVKPFRRPTKNLKSSAAK